MRALIGVLALVVAPMAPAAAQNIVGAAQNIFLAPLSLIFGDISAQLRLFSAGIRALDAQRIAVQKRTALVAELDRLIPSIDNLTAGKGAFYLLLSREQEAARLRGIGPLTAEQVAARGQSWAGVQAGARLLESDLRVVYNNLANAPTLNSELPSDVGNPLYRALGGKGKLDAAIAKLSGGPADPAQDGPVLAHFASDYMSLRSDLAGVTAELRAFRRRLSESQ